MVYNIVIFIISSAQLQYVLIFVLTGIEKCMLLHIYFLQSKRENVIQSLSSKDTF